ncbi:hypothetical protein NC652_012875 [Populus alba x Populus x berolinensis]|nr:hypothetical protein NC652_012875 [Populus alba x Populus x berolinensis]
MSKSEGSTGEVNACVLLKWMGCEANFEEGWATLNTLSLFLHRHLEARSRLVKATPQKQSAGFCIDATETAIDEKEY